MSSGDGTDFNPKTDFRYVMGEKPELVVVLFYGKISQRENEFLLEIEGLLKEKPQLILLLNFHDVAVLMPAAHKALAKFQKSLRDAGKFLGICSLNPEIKLSLLQAGIIRESELFNNIPDAWKTLHAKVLQVEAKKAPEESSKEAA